ncbi:acylphosphatase [Arthrobacter rhombi]|uniref:acylphosphatase n=1 Tax=Arthrobacter rhombi TaxID=71253 RepID=UPI003FD69C88
MSTGPNTHDTGGQQTGAAVTAGEAMAHGTVQGVGFRYRTRERAEALGVAGSAVNLPDGSVCVTAQGSADAVAALFDWLRSPRAPGRVERLDVRQIEVRGGRGGFEVG